MISEILPHSWHKITKTILWIRFWGFVAFFLFCLWCHGYLGCRAGGRRASPEGNGMLNEVTSISDNLMIDDLSPHRWQLVELIWIICRNARDLGGDRFKRMLLVSACRWWCVPSTDNIWQLEGPPGRVNCPIPYQTAVISRWKGAFIGETDTQVHRQVFSSP